MRTESEQMVEEAWQALTDRPPEEPVPTVKVALYESLMDEVIAARDLGSPGFDEPLGWFAGSTAGSS